MEKSVRRGRRAAGKKAAEATGIQLSKKPLRQLWLLPNIQIEDLDDIRRDIKSAASFNNNDESERVRQYNIAFTAAERIRQYQEAARKALRTVCAIPQLVRTYSDCCPYPLLWLWANEDYVITELDQLLHAQACFDSTNQRSSESEFESEPDPEEEPTLKERFDKLTIGKRLPLIPFNPGFLVDGGHAAFVYDYCVRLDLFPTFEPWTKDNGIVQYKMMINWQKYKNNTGAIGTEEQISTRCQELRAIRVDIPREMQVQAVG